MIFRIIIIFFCVSNLLNAQNNELTIGTFNIKWLGDGIEDKIERRNSDYAKLASILKILDFDVLALQEIENKNALKLITVYTNNYNLYISPTPEFQKVAYLIKKDIKLLDIQVLKALKLNKDRLRPGLMLYLKKDKLDFIVANVHFKSTSRYDDTPEKRRLSFYYRKKQSEILSKYLDELSAKHNEQDIVLLGDFNDNPNKKYSNIKQLEKDYNFLTKDMTSCKNYLWSVIDHIAISKSLNDNLLSKPFMFDLTSAFDENEIEFISDHCPVLLKISTNN